MRLRSQTGQTAAEYMGALLIVAAVIGVLVTTNAGTLIGWDINVLVCRIAGQGGCEKHTPGNPEAPPLSQCVISASDRSLEASVKVFVFKLEGGVTGIKRVAADGTTTITLKANAGAGLNFSTPGASAEGGGAEASSPKGEFSVTGKGEFSRTWKFSSEGDADSFVDHVVDKVKAKLDWKPDFLQSADDYELPPQDSDTVYGGIAVAGSSSAGAGGAYAHYGGGVEAGVGARFSANGDRTYFFKAKANVDARAGSSLAGGFGVNGDGEIMIGITYDKNGHEKAMTINGVGTIAGGLDLRGSAENLSGLLGSIEKAGGAATGQAGKRIEFESTLDLTVPANRDAVRAFIDGVNPATGGPVDLALATKAVYDRFDAQGATNVRLYDVSKDSLGVDIDGSVLGFSAKYSQSDATLTDAWFDPGPGGFQPWFDCSAAVH
ncbi:MAG TPA: hypothetical protein VNS09_12940 [Solirubrobacter sp.]|nr:hypothetical protein [Solirubrobacter sp.]